MAASGYSYSARLRTSAEPGEVTRRVAEGVAGSSGIQMSGPALGTLLMERTYRPSWAITLAVITGILSIVGLLFLLIKRREVLTVIARTHEGGSEVTVSGVSAPAALDRLTGVLSGLPDAEGVDGLPIVSPQPGREAYVYGRRRGVKHPVAAGVLVAVWLLLGVSNWNDYEVSVLLISIVLPLTAVLFIAGGLGFAANVLVFRQRPQPRERDGDDRTSLASTEPEASTSNSAGAAPSSWGQHRPNLVPAAVLIGALAVVALSNPDRGSVGVLGFDGIVVPSGGIILAAGALGFATGFVLRRHQPSSAQPVRVPAASTNT